MTAQIPDSARRRGHRHLGGGPAHAGGRAARVRVPVPPAALDGGGGPVLHRRRRSRRRPPDLLRGQLRLRPLLRQSRPRPVVGVHSQDEEGLYGHIPHRHQHAGPKSERELFKNVTYIHGQIGGIHNSHSGPRLRRGRQDDLLRRVHGRRGLHECQRGQKRILPR